MYSFLYRIFDQTIYLLDKKATEGTHFPKWFMTLVSAYGLGFQLLIISVLLIFNLDAFVIPFFIGYSFLIPVIIIIRQLLELNAKQ